MKKIIIVLSFLILLFNISTDNVYAADEIQVIVEYRFIDTDVKPKLIEERTVLPIRPVVEALNLSVQYEDGVITIFGNDNKIILYNNSDTALVNDKTVFLDIPVFIQEGRTMLPLRFIAESLGIIVHWDSEGKYVLVGTKSFSNLKTLTYSSGSKYEGQTKDGKYHGFGKLSWPDGSYYEGEWINGLYHGKGIYYYNNKDKYIGEFKNGKKDGNGTYIYSNGQELIGTWYNGKIMK